MVFLCTVGQNSFKSGILGAVPGSKSHSFQDTCYGDISLKIMTIQASSLVSSSIFLWALWVWRACIALDRRGEEDPCMQLTSAMIYC